MDSLTNVSAHVYVHDRGCLNFIQKNFQFFTMPFWELVHRCSCPTDHPPLISQGERYYFRSIGKNPRKVTPRPYLQFSVSSKFQDRSWLHRSFPQLAEDLKLPDFIEQTRLFSTVLRVAAADVHLWTHFDVLDNLLIQLQGKKIIKLWPPSDDPYLYVTGSSSEVVDVDNPDLKTYPLYARSQCTEITLEAGQVLYIPALWFHNVATECFSVSVNAFFRHLDVDIHDRRDLYGNRDPIPVQEANSHLQKLIQSLATLPEDYKSFYGRRLLHQFEQALCPE